MQIVDSVRERALKGAMPEPTDSALEGLTSRPAVFILGRATLRDSGAARNAAVAFFRRILLEDVYGEASCPSLRVNPKI